MMTTTTHITREQVIAILKNARISPSEQRIAIYDFILKSHLHPTVDQVFKNLVPRHPTLSRTTVYNTLKLLAVKHLVEQLNIDDCELRYEAEKTPHAHFKCTCCHKVWDIFHIQQPELPPDQSKDFTVTATQLNFYGICHDCLMKQNPQQLTDEHGDDDK